MSDFAIENFLFLGPLIALGGLVAWFASRDSTSPGDADDPPSGNDGSDSCAPAQRDADS
ncbi:hypothetical protein BSLA_03r1198 [Burkholderia stabilis]|nr:hypothetical protein BSLA_03r1198 [Burkholderia stabilis]